MATIWKIPFAYSEIREDGSLVLEIPEDAEVLSVQLQGDSPILLAKVDPNLTDVARKFYVVGTGQTFPEGATEFIGAWQDGPHVWHLFEGDL
jgi:hypothetical protein